MNIIIHFKVGQTHQLYLLVKLYQIFKLNNNACFSR